LVLNSLRRSLSDSGFNYKSETFLMRYVLLKESVLLISRYQGTSDL